MPRDAQRDTQYSSIDKKAPATRKWIILSILLALIAIGLLIALLLVVLRGPHRKPESGPVENIDVTEAGDPGVFHDLTRTELSNLQEYLYSDKAKDLNLVRPGETRLKTNYVFVSDFFPPSKPEVLAYLDGNGPKPERKARILVFKGAATPPVVEEYLVSPLPNPTKHELMRLSTRQDQIPFAYRPIGMVEYEVINEVLLRELRPLSAIFMESYGAKLEDCGLTCLVFYPHPSSSEIVGADVRKIWLEFYQYVPYYILNPAGFAILLNCDGNESANFTVEKLVYSQERFNSVNEFVTAYNSGTIPRKTKIPFPTVDDNHFSVLGYRGQPPVEPSRRAPRLVEPDGKRFSIKHRHVEYMDWKFDFRMSSLMGPQVFNIIYGKDRIAYEIGLQEIMVFYSGSNPATRMTDFVDSGALLGTHSKSLIPGGDCPETAVFISATFLSEKTDTPYTNERAFCVFEQNTGVPLKRHLSYSTGEGGFYGGVMDNVLILRSILTVVNYDYIFDFIFHQNGAMEVRAVSTGYIYATYYYPDDDKYGFQLHKNLMANMHHHSFNFKVDLDVLGTSNRYETLDILTEEVDNSMWTDRQGDTYNQIYYQKTQKTTEQEAAYKFNFDTPKYHIFHNENQKTAYGVPRAYRVQMNGMSKQTLTENKGNEKTVPWARYQMAVTKYKPDEFCSSSPYKMFDARSPIIDFQKYIDDNDNIVDQDLVLWLTMGVHHIPHTEDLPITPTPGAHLSFALLPYNYFTEDPSGTSPDMITVRYKNVLDPTDGVLYKSYSNSTHVGCVNINEDFQQDYESNPDLVIQSKRKQVIF